jgi:hypothetical protein
MNGRQPLGMTGVGFLVVGGLYPPGSPKNHNVREICTEYPDGTAGDA